MRFDRGLCDGSRRFHAVRRTCRFRPLGGRCRLRAVGRGDHSVSRRQEGAVKALPCQRASRISSGVPLSSEGSLLTHTYASAVAKGDSDEDSRGEMGNVKIPEGALPCCAAQNASIQAFTNLGRRRREPYCVLRGRDPCRRQAGLSDKRQGRTSLTVLPAPTWTTLWRNSRRRGSLHRYISQMRCVQRQMPSFCLHGGLAKCT